MSWRSLAFGLRENQAYLAVFVLCKCFANQRLFGQQAHTQTHTQSLLIWIIFIIMFIIPFYWPWNKVFLLGIRVCTRRTFIIMWISQCHTETETRCKLSFLRLNCGFFQVLRQHPALLPRPVLLLLCPDLLAFPQVLLPLVLPLLHLF